MNQCALEKYCGELPGARIFLENFFLTSEGMDVPDVFMNYQMDLRLYSPTNKTIRENKPKMYEAFSAISGIAKRDVESMNAVYGDGLRLFAKK
ncbi:MAG: hypothetical protein AB1656_06145 [Candidatus Omnitrophota bacterium]